MKYFQFYRESNEFQDILEDPSLKKKIYTKIQWRNYLLIGLANIDDNILSYIEIKYGDSIRNSLSKDYSPIPYVDYVPIKR